MKTILTGLALFVVLGAGAQTIIVNENFDSDNGSWVEYEHAGSPTGATIWEWGDPAATQINDDNGGGGNAWVTKLDGEFTILVGGTQAFLTSPPFDLSTLTEGSISFALNYDLYTGGTNDGMRFEYSTDSSTWSLVGTQESGGINWYNGVGADGDGWTGNSGGWEIASHEIPASLLGESVVYFRLKLYISPGAGGYGSEGFAIDDFKISDETIESEILSMTVAGEVLPALIDSAGRTINLYVPASTDVTSLAPTFSMSPGASSNLPSGSTQDFTNPVEYTITAENTFFSSVWTVTAVSMGDLAINFNTFPSAATSGSTVSIYGTGFSSTIGDNTVTFDGVAATVTEAATNKLVVTVPPSTSLGVVDLVVSSNTGVTHNSTKFTILDDSPGTALDGDFNFDAETSLGITSQAVSDIDRDGDFDLIYDDGSTVKISLFENGEFDTKVELSTNRANSVGALELAVADLNNDSLPDIIAGGAELTWFENLGNNTWSSETLLDNTLSNYDEIKVFDADKDFDPDIMVVSGSNVYLLKNDGSASFTSNYTIAASTLGFPIDWDEDGDIDMLHGNDNNFMFLENNGSGIFSDSIFYSIADFGVEFIIPANLDDDGFLELVYNVQSFSNSSFGYLSYNGSSFSENQIAIEGVNIPTHSIKVGDLNGDGIMDIARTYTSSPTLKIYYGDISGNYSTSESFEGYTSTTNAPIDLIDIDSDGDLDIIHESTFSGQKAYIFRNAHDGTDITAFSFTEQTGDAVIDTEAKTVEIEVENSANLTSLTPTISISTGATIDPASGVAQDFSAGSVNYTIISDRKDTVEWTVTVDKIPDPPAVVVDTESITTGNATISWNQPAYTAGYNLEFATNEEFTAYHSNYDPLVIADETTTEATIYDLFAGTYYYARMQATNATGSNSEYSDTLTILTLPSRPDDLVVGNITSTTINISWAATTEEVNSYDIELSTDEFATIESGYPVTVGDGTTFTIGQDSSTQALSSNTEYWVRMVATNATGNSTFAADSNIFTKPGIPTLPEAEADNITENSATIAWDAVVGGTDSYSLELSSSDFSIEVNILEDYPVSTTATTFEFGVDGGTMPLNSGTEYWLRISAINTSGSDGYSNVISFLTRPGAVTATDATNIAAASFTANWDAQTGTDEYHIEVSSDNFTTLVFEDTVTTTSAIVNGLEGGITYSYRVTAINGTGAGDASNVISVLTTPNAPTINSIENSAIDQTSVEVTWQEATGEVDSYLLELSTTDVSVDTTIVSGYPITAAGSATATTLTSLETGTNYWIVMKAVNGTGESDYSNVVAVLTIPSTPTATDATGVSSSAFIANWEEVSAADEYFLEVSSDDFTTNVYEDTLTTLSGNVTGLESATIYKYRVSSVNSTGASPTSSEISVLTKPDAPIINSIANSDITQSTIDISWSASSGIVDQYLIDLSTTDVSTDTTLVSGYPVAIASSSTSTTLSSLDSGTDYWVVIRAVNESGESENSNVVTALTLSAAPVPLDGSDVTDNSFTANWESVSTADAYYLEVSSDDFVSLDYEDTLTALSSNITGLESGVNYEYRVSSINATGTSPASSEILVLTKPGAPTVDSPINADISQTSINLSWGAPTGIVDEYLIDLSTTDVSIDTTLVSGYPISVSGTSTTLSTLDTGSEYWIIVRASNSSGESDNSNVVTALTIPATPAALVATDVLADQFAANWDPVTGADAYILQVSNTGFSSFLVNDTITTLTYTVTGLAQGSAYEYRVSAFNATGASGYSNEVVVETNAVPDVPILSNAVINENLPVGSIVGLFTTEDDESEVFEYTFVSGTGDSGNELFQIVEDTLKTNAVFNHEEAGSHQIRIQTDDGFGGTREGMFTITVQDVNEAPTAISFTPATTPFTGYDPVQTIVGSLDAEDEDQNDVVFNYEVVQGDDLFEVNIDDKLVNTQVIATEVDSVINITISASDDEGATLTMDFDIFVAAFVDQEAPIIEPSPTNPTNFLSGGPSITLGATVTDFRIDEVRFYSKLLTEQEFSSQVLLSETDAYEITIAEDDLGVAGIEYYFEAVDEAGNESISARTELGITFTEGGESSPVVESVKRFGRSVDNYQILSIPFVFQGTDNRVDVIFDEYGGVPDNRTWRMIRFDQATTELVNLTASYQIQLGEAYFFIAEEERQITVGNATINLANPYTLNLSTGWNFIGNPYNVDIDWNSVLERNDLGEVVGPLRVLDPASPETWPESSVLKKFEGAFVQVTEDVDIPIHYEDAILSIGRVDHVPEDPDVDWFVPITLTQGDDFRRAGIGMDQNAKVTLDKNDQLVLPRWFKYLEFSSLHPEEKFSRFNRDVVPLSDRHIWEIEISSSSAGISTLQWQLDKLNQGYLKLLDKSTGRVIDMTQTASFDLLIDGVTQLSIMYSSDPNDSFSFNEIAVMDAYPNPMTSSVIVPVSLPHATLPYRVQIDLVDLTGKVVWSQQSAGLYGGNYQLEVIPEKQITSGMYLYKVSIEHNGQYHIFTKRISAQ